MMQVSLCCVLMSVRLASTGTLAQIIVLSSSAG